MKISILMRRFESPEHMALYRTLAQANKQAAQPTRSERIFRLLDNSLQRDIRDGAKPQPHQRDIISLGRMALTEIESRIPEERRQAEIDLIKSELEATSEFIRARSNRLRELTGMSSGYISRQEEISLAAANAERKLVR